MSKKPKLDDSEVAQSIDAVIDWLSDKPQAFFFLRTMGENCADQLLLKASTHENARNQLRKLTDTMIAIERELADQILTEWQLTP